jgi:phosphoesterase RecJ-like protein
MIDEIKKEIEKAQNILLHCHPSPDPDSVGSTLAMKFALEQMGKKVTLIKGDSEIPKAFVFPGIETIVQKNFFEVDLKDFDLFLILDATIARVSTLQSITIPKHLKTIIIDHHVSNPGLADINYIKPEYSSTAEIIFGLLKGWNIAIDHDIALNLFMGIYTDTGGYRYGQNIVKTLEVASELAKIAPDFQKTIFTMENSNRKETIIFESLALSSLKIYNDKFALVSVSHTDLLKNNISGEDTFTGGISNKIKSILGIEISATLIEKEEGIVKVSFRSSKHDISKLAVMLGGGGHKFAAGATIPGSLHDAILKVVKIAKDLYTI